jgi:isocitrate dehydrogenase (NAD+)
MSKRRIVIIPGDGIGPSIVDAAVKVLDCLDCGFDYIYADAGNVALEKCGKLIPDETLDAIKVNQMVIKGPLTTPVGEGFSSVNVALRKIFDLYANVRPVVSFKGTLSRYENIDILTVRENTEGMYSGQGQVTNESETYAEALSVMTTEGAQRVVRFAYELARKKGRKKMTVVHKANILKSTSGLFLRTARNVGKLYNDIETNEMIVDNCCMQLVMRPEQFDMIVTTNLFGDIISDLCAGLVGGLGMAPGANIGDKAAIFEAVHGSAPDIAGKNIANPTAIMLAAALMLDHLDLTGKSELLRGALRTVIEKGKNITCDLGGCASTTEFTEAVIRQIRKTGEGCHA